MSTVANSVRTPLYAARRTNAKKGAMNKELGLVQHEREADYTKRGNNCKKCGHYRTDFKNSREVFRKYLSSMGWDENHPQAKLYKFREYPEHMVCKCKADC